MYLQITPNFVDGPHDVPNDIPQAIKDELRDITHKMAIMMDSRPEHLCADEFFNKNSRECVCILFNNDVPIDIISKTLKKYTECDETMKEANHENLEHFTTENFLQILHMAISENMHNEGPDRKKTRV